MTQKKLKVHITGMGGQGIGSTSRVLATAAEIADLTVMTMETHGLAQRGGVVISDLAIGYDPTESPLCALGEADVLIALEALESLRSMPKLRKDGVAVVNMTTYQPLSVRVSKGKVNYPSLEKIEKELHKITKKVLIVPAQEDARELGLSQAMNVILIGALTANTAILPFSEKQIRQGIKKNLPPKYHDINLKAFEKGLSYKL
ncbi:MAG: indolepyruvate oxidoreductase subunit beta [Asgard group archaeon]|nr:indolepyruvate oxidoreductase subunit beta [Asgard group archaeon]